MSDLYASGIQAAEALGSDLLDVRNHLQRARINPYNLYISEDVVRQFNLLTNLLREFLALSLGVEIKLMVMGMHEHSEVVKRDKRVIRDRVRDELNDLRIAAADLGVEGLRVSFADTVITQNMNSPVNSPQSAASWDYSDLGRVGDLGQNNER